MDLRLYDYWRSGAAHRVRIGLNLKGLAYEQIVVDLRQGEQHDPAYLTVNPQGRVPTLSVDGAKLSQSLAILEWLEERFPAEPLLPGAAEDRAMIRSMAALVACDIHPLNNLAVLQRLCTAFQADEADISAWISHWITVGFSALEPLIEAHGHGFAFGSAPTLADCCLIPQIYSAERFAVDLSAFPRICAVGMRAGEHPAFIAAHPSRNTVAD